MVVSLLLFSILFLLVILFLLKKRIKQMKQANSFHVRLLELLCGKYQSDELSSYSEMEVLKAISDIISKDIEDSKLEPTMIYRYDFKMMREIPEIFNVYLDYVNDKKAEMYILNIKNRVLGNRKEGDED